MCSIVGVAGCNEASSLVRMGLRQMQHRGQESAGIVASDGETLRRHAGMGLVDAVFPRHDLADVLPGHLAIGQNRYSTAGVSSLNEAQPFLVSIAKYGNRQSQVALGHNGNLPFADQVRERLVSQGSIFQSTSDTETLLHLISTSRESSFTGALLDALRQSDGAYALLVLTEEMMIAVKDPFGLRPLCIGRLNGSWVVASESCALKRMHAEYVREMENGEMLIFTPGHEPVSSFPLERQRLHQCIFEKVYLARPNSFVFGDSANKAKYKMGRQLAIEYPVEADMVVPVPDSGSAAASGYAKHSGIPFMLALLRDHYSDRTFIHPHEDERFGKVEEKLSAVEDLLEGKRVILVDDSIVRANTSKSIVRMVRDAGASEIHMCISSPPTIHPCFYGLDTPTEDKLIAARMSVEDIRRHLGCDSLSYLSLKGMLEACDDESDSRHCHACFSGEYPIEVRGAVSKYEREHRRQS